MLEDGVNIRFAPNVDAKNEGIHLEEEVRWLHTHDAEAHSIGEVTRTLGSVKRIRVQAFWTLTSIHDICGPPGEGSMVSARGPPAAPAASAR